MYESAFTSICAIKANVNIASLQPQICISHSHYIDVECCASKNPKASMVLPVLTGLP